MGLKTFQLVHNIFGYLFFGLEGVVFFVGSRDDGDFIGVGTETCAFILEAVEHDEIEVFLLQFGLCIRLFIIRFEGKSHEGLPLLLHLT